jgi:hypothetical protein
VPESFAHFVILSAAKDLFDYRSDADHPTPGADHADPDADGVDPFALVDDSAAAVAHPSSNHCDPYGFMYESDGLVCEADDFVCESDDFVCESHDFVCGSGEGPSASFAGVSKPADLVVDSADLVADPFRGLCESDAAVAESVGVRADPGGDVGGSGADVADLGEDVGISDALVGLPGEHLRDPDDSVAVLSRVHPVTYTNVRVSGDLHAVPVAALRDAVAVVSDPDDLLCDRIGNAADAVEATSGSEETHSFEFCRIWDMVRPFRDFSSGTRTKRIVYCNGVVGRDARTPRVIPCARNGTPDAA